MCHLERVLKSSKVYQVYYLRKILLFLLWYMYANNNQEKIRACDDAMLQGQCKLMSLKIAVFIE